MTGWGAICNCHFDADAGRTGCKKAVMLSSSVSEATAVLRLKRWLIAGVRDEHFPPHRARSHHVGLGGKGLVDFAHGETEQELDEFVARLAAG